jgi:hypothetical protein
VSSASSSPSMSSTLASSPTGGMSSPGFSTGPLSCRRRFRLARSSRALGECPWLFNDPTPIQPLCHPPTTRARVVAVQRRNQRNSWVGIARDALSN